MRIGDDSAPMNVSAFPRRSMAGRRSMPSATPLAAAGSRSLLASLLALLASCSSAPPSAPPPGYPGAPGTALPPAGEPAAEGPVSRPPIVSTEGLRPTGRGRWVRSDWAELPGWPQDRLLPAWQALLRSCDRQLAVLVTSGGNGAAAAPLPPRWRPRPDPLPVPSQLMPLAGAPWLLLAGADSL